ncbi:MAG: competence/damage-inducible protein A [Verrucomicrobiota bacterium]|nr:competence/damage-inducible protein A [Verrucomicrobiota bacterium]
MNVEVINTGTEILLGSITNTHLKFFAEELFPLGLRIQRQVTVPDGDAIRDALVEAFARAEIVLVTGGLGPTTDDITREITAELLGLELVLDENVKTAIEQRFARRGATLTDRVLRQAQVPRGATALPNENGTAPGLYLKTERSPHLFLLPGPPRELKPMFFESVAPILKTIVPPDPATQARIYRIVGMGESNVEALVGEQLLAVDGLELGYCARPGEVDVRCIGSADVLARAEEIITSHLSANIVARGEGSLESAVVEKLIAAGKTIAVAESCTGGFLANRLTNVPGSSATFLAGFVTYANAAKTRELGVPASMIESAGAVSHEVAVAMAEGALKAAGADFALATTGVAGPGGGTAQKPVGTVYIALAAAGKKAIVERHNFPMDRETFKWLATQTALDLLRRALLDDSSPTAVK